MPRTPEQISYNMSRIRSKNTKLERTLCAALFARGYYSFERNVSDVPGHPDILFRGHHLAIFCDGDFWHGFNWEERRQDIKSHRDYWINKIERNIARDQTVAYDLDLQGWTMLRYWEHDINRHLDQVIADIEAHLRTAPPHPLRLAEVNVPPAWHPTFAASDCYTSAFASLRHKRQARAYAESYGLQPNTSADYPEMSQAMFATPYEVLFAYLPYRSYRASCPNRSWDMNAICNLIALTRPRAFLIVGDRRLVTVKLGFIAKKLLCKLAMSLNYDVAGASPDEESWCKLELLNASPGATLDKKRQPVYFVGMDRERYGNALTTSLTEGLYPLPCPGPATLEQDLGILARLLHDLVTNTTSLP